MSPVIEVQVSDEVAEQMVRKLQLVNLHPEAACMAVLLRDRSDLRREVSGAGSSSKAEAQGPMVAGSPMPDGIVEGSETGPAPLTSPSPDTSTIRAALNAVYHDATGGTNSFWLPDSHRLGGLAALDRLVARLETACREQARLERHIQGEADAWKDQCDRRHAAEAALGAARERIRELESEAGGRRSASPSSECPACDGRCSFGDEPCRSCRGTGIVHSGPPREGSGPS